MLTPGKLALRTWAGHSNSLSLSLIIKVDHIYPSMSHTELSSPRVKSCSHQKWGWPGTDLGQVHLIL